MAQVHCSCGWASENTSDPPKSDEEFGWLQWINHDIAMYKENDPREHAGYVEQED